MELGDQQAKAPGGGKSPSGGQHCEKYVGRGMQLDLIQEGNLGTDQGCGEV